jgi:hypothetical protein
VFKIRDEWGQLVLGSTSRRYSMTCRIAHFMREIGSCDFFVVDTSTGRAVSEVFNHDAHWDLVAAMIADNLWKRHKELV